MALLLRNLVQNLDDGRNLRDLAAERLGIAPMEILALRIVRKSIDARRKAQIKFIHAIEFSVANETALLARQRANADLLPLAAVPPLVMPQLSSSRRIVIAGMGPAGLFAALRLADYGLCARVLERGRPVEERAVHVQRFWKSGELDPESNVQFGEGGAGTFSDGKLTTRVNDANIAYVLGKLADHGAPPEILYVAKPHVGTDMLRGVIVSIRQHLESRGFAMQFSRKLTDLGRRDGRLTHLEVNDGEEIPCDFLVLAPGHSARDTYSMLVDRQVELRQKPFAIGVRVEHPQALINTIQFGIPGHPRLPAADYALAWNDADTGRSVYSFCMCPGGEVVASASESGGVVTNGMSGYRRDLPYANSALVVSVGREDFGDGPLDGVEFQRFWERKAFLAGGSSYRAPAQNLLSFLGGKRHSVLHSTYRPGIVESDLDQTLPAAVATALRSGLRVFDRKMKGFVTGEASLIGVETRTSAPVRIVRGDDFQSVSLSGLYPAGEGAGYAGGIMSAALDGIRVADAIARRIKAETRQD